MGKCIVVDIDHVLRRLLTLSPFALAVLVFSPIARQHAGVVVLATVLLALRLSYPNRG